MVLPREFLLFFFCASFLFFSLLSSRPVPSFYNGVFLGVPGSPVLLLCKQSMFGLCHLGKSFCRFLSLFPSLGSDSFESSWLAILFGTCWGMPFSVSSFLAYSFLSYLGGILFCHFWKSFVAILSSLSWFPEALLLSVPWKVACVSCSFLFLSSFYRSVPVFSFFFFYLCLKGFEDPCFFIFCRGLFLGWFFLFWASGSSGPSFCLPWVIRAYYFWA